MYKEHFLVRKLFDRLDPVIYHHKNIANDKYHQHDNGRNMLRVFQAYEQDHIRLLNDEKVNYVKECLKPSDYVL